MKEFIEKCIKDLGVQLYAERKFIESYLDFYQFLIKDKTGTYRFLEVFFNDTDIFCRNIPKEQVMIGSGSFEESLESKLVNSMGIGSSFKDCRTMMIDNVNELKIKKFLEVFQRKLIQSIFNIYIDGIDIVNVKFVFKPVAVIVIELKDRGVYVPPLKMFLGSKCSKDGIKSIGINLFIDELNTILSNGTSLCKLD